MSVEITLAYEGELRCSAEHGPSGVRLHTDAPVDNCGKGESFSPTDLVATALGACVLTILGIQAQKHNLDLTGTTVHVEKHMAAAPLRRIAKLPVHVHLSVPLSPRFQALFQRAAATCPVHQSLREDIERPINFHWKSDDSSELP
ncbi:MAG: OsmC family protein [Planctomycetes bacterium]|nr:OsmC family protein [Planctomycetota bacterium]